VKPAPAPPPAKQAAPAPPARLEVTEPELEIGEPATQVHEANEAPTEGFAATDFEPARSSEAPTDEHRAFEPPTQPAPDLAVGDDSLDLISESDLGELTTDVDLGDMAPGSAEDSAGGLFEDVGTDLSTLPEEPSNKKS
jgi:hypothetical protein